MWYKYPYYSRDKLGVFLTHLQMLFHCILKIENDVQTLSRNHFEIRSLSLNCLEENISNMWMQCTLQLQLCFWEFEKTIFFGLQYQKISTFHLFLTSAIPGRPGDLNNSLLRSLQYDCFRTLLFHNYHYSRKAQLV